jgi:glutathione peroxidase
MKYLLILLFTFMATFTAKAQDSTSIYSLLIPAANGSDTLHLADYQGKKILFVNTASGSVYFNQLLELKQLALQFKDSGLVVIACPSNSFHHEQWTDAQTVQFAGVQQLGFPVTAQISVKGADIHSVYKWLTRKTLNGIMNAPVRDDFQKYLLNESGKITGVFDGRLSPLDPVILRAIRN